MARAKRDSSSRFPIQAESGLNWSVTHIGIFYAALSGMMVLVEGSVLLNALKNSPQALLQ
jgi:hypothetical protein